MSQPGPGYSLRILEGQDKGRRFPLEGPELRIGRRPYPGCQEAGWIYLAEPTVSGHHATLRWEEEHGGYHLIHASKTNPTTVNGKAVEKCPLGPGDQVRMGLLVCELLWEDTDEGGIIVRGEGDTLALGDPIRLLVMEGRQRGTSLTLDRRQASLVLVRSREFPVKQFTLNWDDLAGTFSARVEGVTPLPTLVYRSSESGRERHELSPGEPLALESGDLIAVGTTTMLYRMGAAPEAAVSSAALQTVRTAPAAPPRKRRRIVRWPQAAPLSVFFRELASLYAAGIPVGRSMDLLGRSADHPRLAAAVTAIARQIDEGKSLSQGFASFPNLFPRLHLRLVEVGEETGHLDAVLERLAQYEERRHATLARVQSALAYPLLLCASSLVMLVVVPPFLLGNLLALIEASEVPLPFITRVVLTMSHILRNPLFLTAMGAGFAAAVAFGPSALRRLEVRRTLALWVLKVPGLGKVARSLALSRFAHSMAVLLTAGIPIQRGLEMAADASDHPLLQEQMASARLAILNGATLREAVGQSAMMSKLFLQLVVVGEEAGTLPDIMTRLADYYETDTACSVETFTAALGPMMLLAMGIAVGVTVIGTTLPLVQVIATL